MSESDSILKNRFLELTARAFSRECYVYSDFLTLDEQNILSRMSLDKNSAPFSLSGGYDASERKIACFGDKTLCGYIEQPPIICILISPISQKFADVLTHRDFLGSLMGLGFRRNVLGDIVIKENCAYLFCLSSVAPYIIEQFTKVKHTIVQCSVIDTPSFGSSLPDPVQIVTASERLDAIIAAVYKISRSESQQLFAQKKVFVNSRMTENTSFSPAPESIVSVRGLGRFRYDGIEKETRKGKLRVSVRIY